MKLRYKILLATLVLALAVGGLAFYLQGYNIPVLMPEGVIADKQRNLIIFATLLGLLVVVPVFIMLFFVAVKYRESNTKAKYSPEWDSNRWIEGLWWGIPLVIIAVLGVVTWQSSHELDPYRPLDSERKPLNVQVVALQWKWLFIYPDQGIASVNALHMPANTPVNFELTADAPMNSFWIPSLGSQIYAMSGMTSKLHLEANNTGSYDGMSANISGEGFSKMRFKANAMSVADFNEWVAKTQDSHDGLDMTRYDTLADPGVEESPSYYVLKKGDLYDTIVMKYMGSH